MAPLHPPTVPQDRTPETQRAPVRKRALALGVLLIWLSAHWIFTGEIVRYTFITLAAPFCHAVYLLLLVTGANLAIRRAAPRHALTGTELLALYAMVSVASAIMSCDMQSILVTLLGYPTYFADGGNRWTTLFAGALPKWLIVTDREAVAGFFRGSSTFWTPPTVAAWLVPVAAWTAFVWALCFAMLCIAVILRRAWVEQERLTFPIVALPMAMANEPERLFRSRLLWLGFAIAGSITLLNGLNYLYPAVPSVAIKRQVVPFIGSGPLQGASNITLSFYFFAIVLGFLMPLDLGASLALFYVLYRGELLWVASMGLPPESKAPYTDSQAFGAYAAVFCVSTWHLKGHLKGVWRAALRRAGGADDSREPLGYRAAVAGLAASLLFVLGFVVAAGMHPVVAVAFFALFLALAVMISRIRAEFGFPVHDLHQMGPVATLTRTAGAGAFDQNTLGLFALLHWTSRAYRGHPMPHQLEALRLPGPDPAAQRALFRAVLLAGVVAVPICFVVFLDGFYRVGAATANVNTWGTGYAREAFSQNLQTWLRSPAEPAVGDRIATASGFLAALALASLRGRWPGLPLHPLAYAVANSWGMFNLWLPILVGTVCKAAVLRARGLPGYRAATLFFFGLMLGEFAVGCSWTLLGMFLHVQTYEFWP